MQIGNTQEPRFIRDSMAIEDINGAKAKPLYKGPTRNIMQVQDITKSKEEKLKPKRYNLLDYSDVTSSHSRRKQIAQHVET